MTQLALLPDPEPPLPRGYKRVEVYRGHTIATDPATPFGALFQVFDPHGQLIAQAQVSRWAARRLIEGESLSRN